MSGVTAGLNQLGINNINFIKHIEPERLNVGKYLPFLGLSSVDPPLCTDGAVSYEADSHITSTWQEKHCN